MSKKEYSYDFICWLLNDMSELSDEADTRIAQVLASYNLENLQTVIKNARRLEKLATRAIDRL